MEFHGVGRKSCNRLCGFLQDKKMAFLSPSPIIFHSIPIFSNWQSSKLWYIIPDDSINIFCSEVSFENPAHSHQPPVRFITPYSSLNISGRPEAKKLFISKARMSQRQRSMSHCFHVMSFKILQNGVAPTTGAGLGGLSPGAKSSLL